MVMTRKEQKESRIAAFEVIVSHYEGRLIRYVARIVNSEDVAQDVVQDSFIRLFRKWKDKLEPGPQVSSFTLIGRRYQAQGLEHQ